MNIACIVLAAGRGRRFGGQKCLARLPSGRTVIGQSIERLRPYFSTIAVVVGDDPSLLDSLATLGLKVVRNPAPDRGMGSSLALGVAACRDADADLDGVIVALADMPYLASETVAQVRDNLALRGGIVVPKYRGQRGHPVGFSRAYFPALCDLDGDQGARSVLANAGAALHELSSDDVGVVLDIDNVSDLETHALRL